MPATRDEIDDEPRGEIRAAIAERGRARRARPGRRRRSSPRRRRSRPSRSAGSSRPACASIGHNYVQRAPGRARGPSGPRGPVALHRGAAGRGTAHQVADSADVVETVGGERAARRLAGRAARAGRVLDVLIEVDFTGARSGVPPERAAAAADLARRASEGVRLRGLMTIPPSRRPPRKPGRGSCGSESSGIGSGEPTPTCWTSRWGCRWITRSPSRKALRWCASERRCSVPEPDRAPGNGPRRERRTGDGRRVEEDPELPGARRGRRGLRRRVLRRASPRPSGGCVPRPIRDVPAGPEGIVRTIAAPRPRHAAPRRSTSPSRSDSTRRARSPTASRKGRR